MRLRKFSVRLKNCALKFSFEDESKYSIVDGKYLIIGNKKSYFFQKLLLLLTINSNNVIVIKYQNLLEMHALFFNCVYNCSILR